MIEELIARWGYVAIVFGTLFEGETTLLAAGAMAHRGLLSLPLVLAVAFFGGVLGDQIWFQIGRHFGQPFIDRRPAWRRRLAFVDRLLSRYGTMFVVLFRFLPVPLVRTITPVLLGARGYPVMRFALLNVAGGALWTVLLTAAGWGLGAALSSLIGRPIRPKELLLGVLVLGVASWLLYLLISGLRRRREDR
ncbi:MAG: DedA family protein [Hydrocarboniphaga sp.]|uniref:DedA family protein n=1 Tax=Hydrocarboniphaga sp. TaxID=2033016 RepID=UPI002604AFE9|nr:DedA family protein [Hydrocarboniphaga sp.]MDB5971042.1 DedA family protein [Hydrocarboniphaga sp.]